MKKLVHILTLTLFLWNQVGAEAAFYSPQNHLRTRAANDGGNHGFVVKSIEKDLGKTPASDAAAASRDGGAKGQPIWSFIENIARLERDKQAYLEALSASPGNQELIGHIRDINNSVKILKRKMADLKYTASDGGKIKTALQVAATVAAIGAAGVGGYFAHDSLQSSFRFREDTSYRAGSPDFVRHDEGIVMVPFTETKDIQRVVETARHFVSVDRGGNYWLTVYFANRNTQVQIDPAILNGKNFSLAYDVVDKAVSAGEEQIQKEIAPDGAKRVAAAAAARAVVDQERRFRLEALLLRDENPKVRSDAARALGENLGGNDDFESRMILDRARLSETNPEVRAQIIAELDAPRNTARDGGVGKFGLTSKQFDGLKYLLGERIPATQEEVVAKLGSLIEGKELGREERKLAAQLLEDLQKPGTLTIVRDDRDRKHKLLGGGQKEWRLLQEPFEGEAWIEAGSFAYRVWRDNGMFHFRRYSKDRRSALGQSHIIPDGYRDGEAWVVGRKRGSYTIDDPQLSDVHFTIGIDRGRQGFILTVQDHQSLNGTTVSWNSPTAARDGGNVGVDLAKLNEARSRADENRDWLGRNIEHTLSGRPYVRNSDPRHRVEGLRRARQYREHLVGENNRLVGSINDYRRMGTVPVSSTGLMYGDAAREVVDQTLMPAYESVRGQLNEAERWLKAWEEANGLTAARDGGEKIDQRPKTIDQFAAVRDGGDKERRLQMERALLEDGNPAVRSDAARALGEIADPASRPALERALSDPRPNVRWSAARALGENLGGNDDFESRRVLERARLSETNPEVRAQIIAELDAPRNTARDGADKTVAPDFRQTRTAQKAAVLLDPNTSIFDSAEAFSVSAFERNDILAVNAVRLADRMTRLGFEAGLSQFYQLGMQLPEILLVADSEEAKAYYRNLLEFQDLYAPLVRIVSRSQYDEIKKRAGRIVEVGFGDEASPKEGQILSGIGLLRLGLLKDSGVRKTLAPEVIRVLESLVASQIYLPISTPREDLERLYRSMV